MKVRVLKVLAVLALVFSFQWVQAGLFSEIDILVREAATAEVADRHSFAELDQVFYDLTYTVSTEQIADCHWVLNGKMIFPTVQYDFTACVVAQSKSDISVTILEIK